MGRPAEEFNGFLHSSQLDISLAKSQAGFPVGWIMLQCGAEILNCLFSSLLLEGDVPQIEVGLG